MNEVAIEIIYCIAVFAFLICGIIATSHPTNRPL